MRGDPEPCSWRGDTLRDSARGLSARPTFRPNSVARLDRFLHQPPTSDRQCPYATSAQIPQAFVSVARIKQDDAFASVRVVKSAARMFRDKLKESLPPRSIGRIEDFFTKLFEFFNADDSNRFRDGFAPLVIDCFDVDEFIEWHTSRLFG